MHQTVLGRAALAISCVSAGASALHLNPSALAKNIKTYRNTTVPIGNCEDFAIEKRQILNEKGLLVGRC